MAGFTWFHGLLSCLAILGCYYKISQNEISVVLIISAGRATSAEVFSISNIKSFPQEMTIEDTVTKSQCNPDQFDPSN